MGYPEGPESNTSTPFIQGDDESDMKNNGDLYFETETKVTPLEGGNTKTERRYKIAIVLFAVINIFLISLIIVTAVYAFSKPQLPESNIKLCLPCSDLKHHPADSLDGIEVDENKTNCCVKKNEDADLLIGYFTDHWMKVHVAKENRVLPQYECDNVQRGPKPVIKLVGRDTRQTESHHHRLLWDDSHDLSIMNEGIGHHRENGYIEIKNSGLYQIYSQVVLEHDTSTHHHMQHPPFYQHCIVLMENGVMKMGEPMERTILKNSNSYCSSKTDMFSVTSTLSGTFQFIEGDRLAVKVSNKSEVVLTPHMNFFGAHLL